MSDPRSEFLKVMIERGFMHQCTDLDALDEHLSKGSVTSYIGFDATANSLHVGSLLMIMMLRWFQKTGNKPITLMGGGTTKVGDPSGKDESRKLLSSQDIDKNIEGIQSIFSQFLSYGDSTTDALMVNNADWLDNLNYIEFLRDYGPHFSINRMLTMESVKIRLDREQTLSFLEFNYMILQAYDYLELNRKHNCILQLGGSDQWGNIVNGVELTRRVDQKEVYGFTCPLLTTSSGAKMGKSAAGAVWLNADMLSPYDYYQYWRNTEDDDVGRFLKLFTEIPISEIAKLEELKGSEINEAKKVLAFEATKLCHGKTAAAQAAKTAQETFEQGAAAEGLPTIEIQKDKLEEGIPAFILLKDAGLVASNGEARRLIKGGGARINDKKIKNEGQVINLNDLIDNDAIKLSAGKKKHALIKVS